MTAAHPCHPENSRIKPSQTRLLLPALQAKRRPATPHEEADTDTPPETRHQRAEFAQGEAENPCPLPKQIARRSVFRRTERLRTQLIVRHMRQPCIHKAVAQRTDST